MVARAAQLENAQEHEGWKRALEPTIPVAVDYEPGETHWVRTDTENQWESTEAFACWKIDPVTIQQGYGTAQLIRVQEEYRLIFPDHHQVVVGALQVAPASPPPPPTSTELQMNPEVLATLTEEEKQRALVFQTEFLKRLQEIKNGEHLEMFLNYRTAVEAPKAWGFIASAPIFYYFYTLTETNQKATFITLTFCSAGLWIVKRIAAVIYNRKSDSGTKPI